MKKWLVGILVIACMAMGVSAFAHTPPPKIQINGVAVYSDANHVSGKTIMVDVDSFFQVLNQKYTLDKKKKTLTTNKKTVAVKTYKGKVVADLHKLASAVDSEKVTYIKKDHLYYVLALPEGVIKLTPAVPKMGEHWARPQDLPLGPIYGVYQGKLVFLEQMPDYKVFTEGKNIVNLDGMRGYPSPSIVQTDIEFQPHGHEGYMVPHYDIHHYFISDKEQQAIIGDHAVAH